MRAFVLTITRACHLLGFDAVLIHSILDKIPAPSTLLARMGGAAGMVRQSGGLVIVISAYDWNEDVTPRESWVGGYTDKDGIQVGGTGFECLLLASSD